MFLAIIYLGLRYFQDHFEKKKKNAEQIAGV